MFYRETLCLQPVEQPEIRQELFLDARYCIIYFFGIMPFINFNDEASKFNFGASKCVFFTFLPEICKSLPFANIWIPFS